MEIQLDVNNFMLDLERCKNKEEMRAVFENITLIKMRESACGH